MRNLGIAFLALIALFIGGCSIFAIGFIFYDASQNSYSATDGYSGAVLIFAVPILAVASFFAWWAWRARERLWRKIDYLILAFLPICVAVWGLGLFVLKAFLMDYQWASFADRRAFIFTELSRYFISGVVACYILWLIWRAFKASITTQNDGLATRKSGSLGVEKGPDQSPDDKP